MNKYLETGGKLTDIFEILENIKDNNFLNYQESSCVEKIFFSLFDLKQSANLEFKQKKEITDFLLDQNVDINRNINRINPLINSIILNDMPMFNLLIDKGIDINFKSYYDRTALHYAIDHENVDMVKQLIDRGAYVNVQSSRIESPLHTAIRKANSDLTVIKQLIDRGADVNSKNPWKESPLHTAIKKDNSDLTLIKILVENGAYVDTKDTYGYTPLSRAIVDLQPEIVQYLLDRGAYSYYLDYEVIKKEYYSDRINKGIIGRGYRGNDDLESIKAFLNENDFKLENEQ